MPLVSIVIPSRFSRPTYLIEALNSIREQDVDHEVLIGIDRDATAPEGFAERFGVTLCRGADNSQAAALNAGLACAQGVFVAFLEDDDLWLPQFLKTALSVEAPFVSSTQLQVNQNGEVERINDFPTPSGWLVQRSVIDRIGPFVGRWHLDNYFLGRLGEEGVDRTHLVEATAPVELSYALEVRPWLAAVIQQGGPRVRLHRHTSPYPLVIRRSHEGTGVSRIHSDQVAHAESRAEFDRLTQRFGRIPW